MSSPLTFTTEAERLKAREQFVETLQAVYPNGAVRAHDGRRFDAAFPPIAPPRFGMWVVLNEDDNVAAIYENGKPVSISPGFRCVRVVEVDDA